MLGQRMRDIRTLLGEERQVRSKRSKREMGRPETPAQDTQVIFGVSHDTHNQETGVVWPLFVTTLSVKLAEAPGQDEL
jgi:hypothetical protein